MCCFTQEVEVSGTNIFARVSAGKQFVVYRMTFESKEDVAMVLPVPVPAGSGETAVEFIDLSGYTDFFERLSRGFMVTGALAGSAPREGALADEELDRLAVHDVGKFEASFVPSPREFMRLDPRFRLSPDVLAALPKYADWGFVVFKLRAGSHEPHPMAFSFPTRSPGEVFFPCVHVHDGRVHETAEFDHHLYAQLDDGLAPAKSAERVWTRSSGIAGMFVDTDRAKGVVSGDSLAFRVELEGTFPNDDVWATGAPESVHEAEERAKSLKWREDQKRAQELWRQRQERERNQPWIVRGKNDAGNGTRLARFVVATPLALALGFILYLGLVGHREGDQDGTLTASFFSVAFLPALWVMIDAATDRPRMAWVATGLAALVVLAAFLVPR